MTNNQPDLVSKFNPFYLGKIKKSWQWLMAIGISLLALGSIAIIKSITTTLVSLYIVGFILFGTGIAYLLYCFKFWWTNWVKFSQYFLLGLLYFIAGLLIMNDPLGTAFPLTAFLAVFYMFIGVWRLIMAFQFPLPRSAVEMFVGILNLILGILIWRHWPSASLWVIGLFVGIDIIFIGVFFISLSLFAKSLASIASE